MLKKSKGNRFHQQGFIFSTFPINFIICLTPYRKASITGAFFIQESEDEMGVRVVFPDMGKDPSVQLIEKTITENGTYDAITDGANGYSKVNVNVEGGGGSSDLTWILPEQTVTLVDQPVEITGLRLDLIPNGTVGVALKETYKTLGTLITRYCGLRYSDDKLDSEDDIIHIFNDGRKDMFVIADEQTIEKGTYTISIALF